MSPSTFKNLILMQCHPSPLNNADAVAMMDRGLNVWPTESIALAMAGDDGALYCDGDKQSNPRAVMKNYKPQPCFTM